MARGYLWSCLLERISQEIVSIQRVPGVKRELWREILLGMNVKITCGNIRQPQNSYGQSVKSRQPKNTLFQICYAPELRIISIFRECPGLKESFMEISHWRQSQVELFLHGDPSKDRGWQEIRKGTFNELS